MHFTRQIEILLSFSLFFFYFFLQHLFLPFSRLRIEVRYFFFPRVSSFISWPSGDSFSPEQSRRNCSSIEIPTVANSINFLIVEFHSTLPIFRSHVARDCTIVALRTACWETACAASREIVITMRNVKQTNQLFIRISRLMCNFFS